MLNNIRKAADSWLFKGLLILIAISFCIWGISDVLRSDTDDKIVTFSKAKPITEHEFLNAQKHEMSRIQNLTGQTLSAEQLKELNVPALVLEQLINSRMLAQLVQKYDLNFSNNLILDQIKKLPVFQNEKGHFDPKMFTYVLQNAGLSEEEYISRVKNEIGEQIVISVFASNALAPKTLIQNITDYFNETRTLEIISINSSNLHLSTNNFPEEELKAYYEATKQNYTIPEKRDFTIATLTMDSLRKDINVTDSEIEKLYQENIEEYKRPELFSFYNLFFADYDGAKKAADTLKNSSNFEEIVVSITNRPASEFLSTRVPLSGLENTISATLKTTNLNSISGIVKTPKGYHVIKKIEQIPAINKNFASVKKELLELAKKKMLEQRFVEVNKSIEDEISAGSNFAEVTKKFNLKTEKVLDVTHQNLSKKINNLSSQELDEKLFALKEGELSDIFEVTDKMHGIVVIEASHVTAEKTKTFEEVRGQIVSNYTADQKLKSAYNLLTEIIKSDSFKSTDGAASLKFTRNYKIARADLINQKNKADFPIELLYRVFLTEKGAITDIYSDGKTLYAAKVTDINLDKSSTKINKKAIEDKLHTNFNNSIFEEIILDLRNQNKMKINKEKLKIDMNN